MGHTLLSRHVLGFQTQVPMLEQPELLHSEPFFLVPEHSLAKPVSDVISSRQHLDILFDWRPGQAFIRILGFPDPVMLRMKPVHFLVFICSVGCTVFNHSNHILFILKSFLDPTRDLVKKSSLFSCHAWMDE